MSPNIIAVMGVTGAGKSTLIKRISGANVEIGNGMHSCTANVQQVPFKMDDSDVLLVDTPGFDDTNLSDTDVLEMIAEFMTSTYKAKQNFKGIIYLHRITDIRMQGSALNNLKMFRKLCGDECLENVVLLTTMWSLVDKTVGEKRETELTNDFWKPMNLKGSRIERYTDDDTILRIIRTLIKKKSIKPKIAKEIVDEGKALIDTQAGIAVNEALTKALQKHQETITDLMKEHTNALKERDEVMKKYLEEQRTKYEKRLQDLRDDQAKLLNSFQSNASTTQCRHEWGNWTHLKRTGRGFFGAHWECIQKGCKYYNDAWMWHNIIDPACTRYCKKCNQVNIDVARTY